MTDTLSLDRYRLLGRSGLRVSPLSLGAMTFGTDWGWGADEQESRRMFDAYVDRGGNFIDTANQYTGGTSEKLVGRFAEGRRDELVIATKYTITSRPKDPNSGGNHRRSMVRSVEDSLKRLNTDYIDLFYLHAWDFTTSVEEVMRGLDDLVRAGKIVYAGISDTPAWQVARMQTLADLRGWAPLVALQIEYSLIERTVERDLIPMAHELGLGVIPWSPLGMGVLTGKYSRADLDIGGGTASAVGTRKNVAAGNGSLTERNLGIADVVKEIAAEIGRTPAQVAIAWTLTNPAITSPIMGVKTMAQFEDNLGALDVVLSNEHRARLAEASAIVLGFPHDFLAKPLTRGVMFGEVTIEPRR
ncbi:aryl-alcohol dehydrogenase-like predicted oxidoreductase [Rhizobium sp. BK650]|uniref:aldo/keto reductase n=1 Tax=Rhizobium sp. BK650 TaxID=2586990 RepID=UPI00160F75FE|nr:aldo/keto reductase [Rhizobium sp. BK650]MBB3657193.1 aryl-alcohol dehydrogenase-like predicted oxidoreductase [Rhizobium sp. BK650]